MVEPGGAIGLAALLAGRLDVKGKVVVAVLSGGNVDPGAVSQAGGVSYLPVSSRRAIGSRADAHPMNRRASMAPTPEWNMDPARAVRG